MTYRKGSTIQCMLDNHSRRFCPYHPASILMEIKEADKESERIINELNISNDRMLGAIREITLP